MVLFFEVQVCHDFNRGGKKGGGIVKINLILTSKSRIAFNYQIKFRILTNFIFFITIRSKEGH